MLSARTAACSARCTASAAPRTCPSRSSWRSPAPSRRWWSPSACSRWPGAPPRYDEAPSGRPAPVPRSGASSTTPGSRGRPARPRPGLRRLPDVGAGLGHPTWSPTRSRARSTCWCGWASCRLAAARAGRRGGQPGPHHQPAAREGHRRRPRQRARHATPTRLGYWPAAVGLFAFVWHGAGQPPERLPRAGAALVAVYLAVMLVGGAVFGARAGSSGRTRSRSTRRLLAQLSVWGRAGDRLVVRSPLANLATVVPAAGPGGRGRGAVRLTAFDSYKDTIPWLQFVQRRGVLDHVLNNLRPAGVLRGRWACVHRRRRCRPGWRHRSEGRTPQRRCPTCSRTRWSRSSSAT